MERSNRREAIEIIRSMSVELAEQVRALLALPAPSRVDRIALERLRGQIGDVAGRASQPLKVAFIGEQSTGKSSILNDLLGTHLPQGENGLDRFVTEIVHPEAAPAWIRVGNAAGLRFRSGETSSLDASELEAFFEQLRTTDRPEEFDDVDLLVVLHPDPWLRHLVFVNTPGLTRDSVHVQRIVSSVVDRAGLVFWVFDARDISNAGIAGRLAETLTGSSSRVHGVLNKVDQFARSEARRTRIIEASAEVEHNYGRFLTSVIPYSARPEVLDGRDPDIIDFKAQLRSLLDARFRDALGGEAGQRAALGQLRDATQLLLAQARLAESQLKGHSGAEAVQLATLRTRVLDPNVEIARNQIAQLCAKHMERIRLRQEPVVVRVLDEEIRTWSALWRGVAGLFDDELSLAARVKEQLGRACGELESDIERVMGDMALGVQEELGLLIARVEADLLRRFKGTKVSISSPGGFPTPDVSRVPMGELPSMPDELLRSLAKATSVAVGKTTGQKLVEVIRGKILASAAEKAGNGVARKFGQAALEKAAAEGAQGAGKVALGAIARDLVTYWLLVTLPLDILDLIQTVDRARTEAKKAAPSWLRRQAEIAADDSAQFFELALLAVRDALLQQWSAELDRRAEGRELLRSSFLTAGQIASRLQECARRLEAHA